MFLKVLFNNAIDQAPVESTHFVAHYLLKQFLYFLFYHKPFHDFCAVVKDVYSVGLTCARRYFLVF